MIPKSNKLKQVLFVCMGNTCRSPMAEYMFRDLCKKENLNIVSVSRGLYRPVEDINPQFDMAYGARAALKAYNPSFEGLENHIAQFITESDIEKSDIILAMDETIRDCVIKLSLIETYRDNPDIKNSKAEEMAESKVFTLKEYAGETDNLNITDPVMEMVDSIPMIHLTNYKFFKKKEAQIYGKCRDEILGCLQKIIEEIKYPDSCEI